MEYFEENDDTLGLSCRVCKSVDGMCPVQLNRRLDSIIKKRIILFLEGDSNSETPYLHICF